MRGRSLFTKQDREARDRKNQGTRKRSWRLKYDCQKKKREREGLENIVKETSQTVGQNDKKNMRGKLRNVQQHPSRVSKKNEQEKKWRVSVLFPIAAVTSLATSNPRVLSDSLEVRNPNQVVSRAASFWRHQGRICVLAFSSVWRCPHSLAGGPFLHLHGQRVASSSRPV